MQNRHTADRLPRDMVLADKSTTILQIKRGTCKAPLYMATDTEER